MPSAIPLYSTPAAACKAILSIGVYFRLWAKSIYRRGRRAPKENCEGSLAVQHYRGFIPLKRLRYDDRCPRIVLEASPFSSRKVADNWLVDP
jgi:hypothetical protein